MVRAGIINKHNMRVLHLFSLASTNGLVKATNGVSRDGDKYFSFTPLNGGIDRPPIRGYQLPIAIERRDLNSGTAIRT